MIESPLTLHPSPTGGEGSLPVLSVVVIGRNEGERLVRCLESVRGMADPGHGNDIVERGHVSPFAAA